MSSSSSDFKSSEQSGAEETDSSSIATSFESQVSARDYYKKGPKKETKIIETGGNESSAAMLESVRRSPRGKLARPSTSKRSESSSGKEDQPSTSKGLESPRRKNARPSTSKGPENPQRKKGRPMEKPSKSKRPESPRVRKIPSTSKALKSPQKGRHEHDTSRKGEEHSRERSSKRKRDSRKGEEHSRERSSKRKRDSSGIANREEVPTSVPTGSKRRKSGVPRNKGTKALMEIKKCQNETRLLLPKLPFARVVREIANEIAAPGLRWQARAIEALQEAAEMYLVHLFEDSLLCTLHRSVVTLKVRDMRLAKRKRARFEDF